MFRDIFNGKSNLTLFSKKSLLDNASASELEMHYILRSGSLEIGKEII